MDKTLPQQKPTNEQTPPKKQFSNYIDYIMHVGDPDYPSTYKIGDTKLLKMPPPTTDSSQVFSYKIDSLGHVTPDYEYPGFPGHYKLNYKISQPSTINQLMGKVPFDNPIVEFGVNKLREDARKYGNKKFPSDYYVDFGKELFKFAVQHHKGNEYKAIKELDELWDNDKKREYRFKNGEGAPLYHMYEHLVTKDEDTGSDKLRHFLTSAGIAILSDPLIAHAAGIAGEVFDIVKYPFDPKQKTGFDMKDMEANNRGTVFGTRWKQKDIGTAPGMFDLWDIIRK